MFKYLICILAGALATSHAYSAEPTLATLKIGQSRIIVSENILITADVLKPTHFESNGIRFRANGVFNIPSFRVNKQPCAINDAGYRNDCSSSDSYNNYSAPYEPYSVQYKKFYYDVLYDLDNEPERFILSAEENLSSHGCWVSLLNSSRANSIRANQILPNSSIQSGTEFTITNISYGQAFGQIILEGKASSSESRSARPKVEGILLGCGHPFRTNKETREEMLKMSLEQIENNLLGLVKF